MRLFRRRYGTGFKPNTREPVHYVPVGEYEIGPPHCIVHDSEPGKRVTDLDGNFEIRCMRWARYKDRQDPCEFKHVLIPVKKDDTT